MGCFETRRSSVAKRSSRDTRNNRSHPVGIAVRRSSVMCTTPNLTRISPLRAGEVGGAPEGQPTLLRSGGKGVSSGMLPCARTRDEPDNTHALPSGGGCTRETRHASLGTARLRASAALAQVTVNCPPGYACARSFSNTSYTLPLEYVGLSFP